MSPDASWELLAICIDILCNRVLNNERGTYLVDNIVGAILAALRALELAKLIEDELIVLESDLHHKNYYIQSMITRALYKKW